MIKYAARHSLARWVVFFAVAVVVALNYFRSDFEWRFELARSTDGAGLYLLLMVPVWAGVAAWDMQQTKTRLRNFLPAVSKPGRTLIPSWVGTVVWALGFHLAVLIVFLGVALASGGLGTPLIALVIVQFLTIAGFCAFGTLMGWALPSPLVGPAIAGGVFAFTTFGVPLNSRNLTDVGIGGADFYGQAPALGHLSAQGGTALVLVGTMVLAALVTRDWTDKALGLGGALAAVMVVVTLFFVSPGIRSTAASQVDNCGTQRITVCVPREYQGRLDDLTLGADDVAVTIADMGGVTADRVLLDVSGQAYEPGVGILVLTPANLQDPAIIDDASIAALTHPYSCDLQAAPTEIQFAVYDTLYALVHARRGTAPQSRSPEDLVTSIQKLPEPEFRQWFATTTEQMWSCELDQIALPASVEVPDWLTNPDG